MTKVRESIDKVGISHTDHNVAIGASKVMKNPKLETTKGAELGALASADFDSEKQANAESIDLELDSVADITSPQKDNNDRFATPNKNLRNSITAPTMGAAANKSKVKNVDMQSEQGIKEMSDEDFSDDPQTQTNFGKTDPTKKS